MSEADSETFMQPERRLRDDTKVPAAPRLVSGIKAMLSLTNFLVPLKVPLRAKRHRTVCYLAGDADGRSFGSFVDISNDKGNKDNFFCYEKLSIVIRENWSSNYKDLKHLIDNLKAALKSGMLEPGTEVFLITNNIVYEYAYYKVNFLVKPLLDLVLELRRLK